MTSSESAFEELFMSAGEVEKLGKENKFSNDLLSRQASAINRIKKSREKENLKRKAQELDTDPLDAIIVDDEALEIEAIAASQEILRADQHEESDDEPTWSVPCLLEESVIQGEFPPVPALESLMSYEAAPVCSTSETDMASHWETLLTQHAVLASLGCSADILKALYATLTSPFHNHGRAAYQQLTMFWRSNVFKPGVWRPSLEDLWISSQSLGFRISRSAPTGESRDKLRSLVPSTVLHNRLKSLRPLLSVIEELCTLQVYGANLFSFKEHGEAGKNLILLLYSLRLDPVVQSSLQPSLSSAADLLLEVWMKYEDASSWREAEKAVAVQLVCLGPSHRASIRLLQGILCRSQATMCFSRTASLLLISQVMGGHSGDVTCLEEVSHIKALQHLLGPPKDVRCLLDTVRQQQQQQLESINSNLLPALDYWKLLTVLQASDLIMWSLQVAGEVSEEESKWWCDILKAVDDKMAKAPQSAAVRKALSSMKNNHDFARF
ncbi:hypothetical protein CEUSTIGMA_g2865.t1 [Chlamydomonas eustigma]|uniref:Coiled-coil SMC6 And NSE5 INteracting (CANIN) domain-containing protein n=1 Tax=Chlamydomonas eustigma TaxID=1157962 RepID=A0A250WX80_9CHLO|nr:hypothetical protein CEUSTIGMA_g2865.t1 [Chlamydomonas eustigma]|eukprot:GAX75421.1 hypothetical protein CEUSTIGMA_g2865.t1 [Chlamydomonas eustigma]